LDHDCTNNQTEYEAVLFGLEILHDMGVKHVEAYGDSLLVVQQVSKCLGPSQATLVTTEVHEGICGTHQLAPKMKWLLKRACYYWPIMIAYCFRYYKGCEECQKHGDVQLVPAAVMHTIIKTWPFRGWVLDFIGKIYPSTSKGHHY
jgi:hypothetical protein